MAGEKNNRRGAGSRKAAPSDNAAFEKEHMIGGNMSFAASEAYKQLRTNLMFTFSDEECCRVIGLTSAFRGEGKSLTSLNLAYTLAETSKRVLLIEGDMRLPTLAKRLGFQSSPGLSNLLVGLNTIGDAIQQFVVPVKDGDAVVLDVIVSGDIPPNPSELLGTARMQSLIRTLKSRYDYIVLDLPPVTAVTDALVVSHLADGMVIVVRNNRAVRGALAETIRQLRLVDTRIIGFVFNGAGDSGSGYYRSRYYSRRYYKGYRKGYGYYGSSYERPKA